MSTFSNLVAQELSIPERTVEAVNKLLEEGNTVPFIARYRKEATGSLDELQIRTIQERMLYLKELEDRRSTILHSIESQGKLSDELRLQLWKCQTKNELEDLYLPYKPKRRTRAMIAREKGLEPLALLILEQPLNRKPEEEAALFGDSEDALSGARDIVAEMVSENAAVRAIIRDRFAHEGVVVSKVQAGKDGQPTKFELYYNFSEPVSKIPSHRYLAIRRGEAEGFLDFHIAIEAEPVLKQIQLVYQLNPKSAFAEQLSKAIQDSYKRLILPSVETDVRVDLKMKADREAVDVFASNLRHLLLAPPLGGRTVIGIDPGLRTGCKCAVVDETGKYLDTSVLYLIQGDQALQAAKMQLLRLIEKYKPFAIGIGNGTAGRETEAFVKQLLGEVGLKEIVVVSVSEAGASVYSASDVAREEFPDLDLTIRGAISIARRLQDPLAELVKVDPKAIGVGQYQHDVYQQLLSDKLGEVVESCVNHVGVEVNTASAPLLSYVAGINASLATKIVKHREKHGAFTSRKELMEVSGLGPRAFEQAAGFLRIRNAKNPLDASAVHPERYDLVEKMAKDLNVSVQELVANQELIRKIEIKQYIDDQVGKLTLQDILDELKKPGRDPRAAFERPSFREDVMSVKDLKEDMVLEGIVTNVTAFGAFVDIGVHQDGLIHISELTDKYIKDPSEVVSPGQKIKVQVMSVDQERNRIALTARLGQGRKKGGTVPRSERKEPLKKPQKPSFGANPFAAL